MSGEQVMEKQDEKQESKGGGLDKNGSSGGENDSVT